jgi:regulator of cell morphogenesis and NO signaling
MILKTDNTVREIAIERPATVHLFESLGIDYCCGGERSLDDACRRANVPLDEALRLLARADEQPSAVESNWANTNLAELTEHIVGQHHGYVRSESPRLIAMLDKVVTRHGEAHPEVASIRELFWAMVDELLAHMMKEENVLFPHLVRMENALREGRSIPPAMFGSVEVPISRMLADHDDAGELAARVRTLSADFLPPEDACPTYRALYKGLEEFERDLHQHIHLENNILFPRALESERAGGAHVRS